MKKSIFIFLVLLFNMNIFSQNIKINYESNEIIILKENVEIKRFSTNRYSNFINFSNKIYYLDCLNSHMAGYGTINYYDLVEKCVKNLNINSGEGFLLLNDFIIIPAIFESSKPSDIEDIFNIGLGDKKRYLINIEVYDAKSYKKIKSFEMNNYIENKIIDYVYLEFKELTSSQVEFSYHILDSNVIYKKGLINLDSLEITIKNE